MLEWRGLNEFLSVAEVESFTLASQRLGISTAQVSRLIFELEARLSVQLFYRTTRKVSLTESGRQLYKQCRPLVAALVEAQYSVSDQQKRLNGRIRLTAPVNFGEQIIGPVVIDFCARHRDVEIDLLLSNKRLDLVQEGMDLAIRTGSLPSSSLKARRLASRALTICASPGYLEKYGTPATPEEISHHSCLVGTSNIWHFCHAAAIEKRSGKQQSYSVRVLGRLCCNSGVTLMDAARRGLGLVQLPSHYVAEAIMSGELVPLLEQYQPVREDIWVVYPPNQHPGKVVRQFVDALEEALQIPSPGSTLP